MIVNIVSGSPNVDLDLVLDYPSNVTIGVDYGAYKLIQHNLPIDLAIGDFDSINNEELEKIKEHCEKVLIYPPMKDETDTELAVNYALSLNPTEINLFGATGKRMDHFLGTFFLFKKALSKNIQLNIIDKHNRISMLKPGIHPIKKSKFKYISLFSFDGPVENLTLTNFKYDLKNHFLNNENSLCLSNELKDRQGTIEFTRGFLLIVESID